MGKGQFNWDIIRSFGYISFNSDIWAREEVLLVAAPEGPGAVVAYSPVVACCVLPLQDTVVADQVGRNLIFDFEKPAAHRVVFRFSVLCFKEDFIVAFLGIVFGVGADPELPEALVIGGD